MHYQTVFFKLIKSTCYEGEIYTFIKPIDMLWWHVVVAKQILLVLYIEDTLNVPIIAFAFMLSVHQLEAF